MMLMVKRDHSEGFRVQNTLCRDHNAPWIPLIFSSTVQLQTLQHPDSVFSVETYIQSRCLSSQLLWTSLKLSTTSILKKSFPDITEIMKYFNDDDKVNDKMKFESELWRCPVHLCMCVYVERVNLWSSSLGLGKSGKAGLAEGCSVPHLQYTVPHHLHKHGRPQLVQCLALQIGVRRPLHQLLEVLLCHGGPLRRLYSALLLGKERNMRVWFGTSR